MTLVAVLLAATSVAITRLTEANLVDQVDLRAAEVVLPFVDHHVGTAGHRDQLGRRARFQRVEREVDDLGGQLLAQRVDLPPQPPAQRRGEFP